MDWTPIIVAGIAAVPGALALVAQAKAQKSNSRKAEAEAADLQVGTSIKLVNSLREEIDKANGRLEELERSQEAQEQRIDRQASEISQLKRENLWLRRGVGVLIRQLEKHNIAPEFTLDSFSEIEEE